jgi:hypothetical protein
VLVIPFYRTSQQQDLGSFLFNWQAVVSAVVSIAVNSIDPSTSVAIFNFRKSSAPVSATVGSRIRYSIRKESVRQK